MTSPVVIGLSAVAMLVTDGEAVVLTVRPGGGAPALPFGPFDPQGDRTFELALRAFVSQQTGFQLGYVEQLYTFGDKGRDAPRAEVGAGAARVVSIGYLALTAEPAPVSAPDTAWSPWARFFPWEDWRRGRPAVLDQMIAPALADWAGADTGRQTRAARLFALGDSPWLEEHVLERYELLYEAGLAPEAERDRLRAAGLPSTEPPAGASALGEPMISDHRRILATGLGRLRSKLKYRPVAFELTPPEFTLSTLQRTVEAIVGAPLHKQNFRRALGRTGLVEGLGRRIGAGGRPAELFRFRRDVAAAGEALGLSLPLLRD